MSQAQATPYNVEMPRLISEQYQLELHCYMYEMLYMGKHYIAYNAYSSGRLCYRKNHWFFLNGYDFPRATEYLIKRQAEGFVWRRCHYVLCHVPNFIFFLPLYIRMTSLVAHHLPLAEMKGIEFRWPYKRLIVSFSMQYGKWIPPST